MTSTTFIVFSPFAFVPALSQSTNTRIFIQYLFRKSPWLIPYSRQPNHRHVHQLHLGNAAIVKEKDAIDANVPATSLELSFDYIAAMNVLSEATVAVCCIYNFDFRT